MKRTTAIFLFFICLQKVSAEDFPIPRVPASIEIAEVKLKITSEAQKEIQKDVNALRASEKYFNIKLDRANLYFPLIEKALRDEGVPDDLKYLSLQESVLVADAVSSAKAVGFWQFKDFTAREVGLRVDSKIDERKNIVASSHGAAKYMKRNNFMLKNWIYAVNAYMTGPGGVKPYIDNDGIGADKLTIDHKTHWYVKRFIAHVIAFKDDVGQPHSEGMELIVYRQGNNKDLKEIAKKLETDEVMLHQFNKWLSYGKVPDDRIYPVIIPVKGKHPNIKEPEKSAPSEKTTYPAQIVSEVNTLSKTIILEVNYRKTVLATPGDDWKSLATKSGTSIDRLVKFNDLDASKKVEAGKFYFTESKRNRSNIRYHVTGYGESLWEISQRYGIKLRKIRKKNRIGNSEKLKPGRILWLKEKRPKNIPPAYRKVENPTVKHAPKPQAIQKKEQVAEQTNTVKTLTQNTEKTEQTPLVKPPVTKEISSQPVQLEKPKVDVHEVAAGESLYGIAKKYDITVEDLLDWNGLKKNESINPGQKLLINSPIEVGILEDYDESEVEKASGKEKVHVVQPDDTYYSLSRMYEVDIVDILKRNRLNLGDPIKPGQELVIPFVQNLIEDEIKKDEGEGNLYTVEAGDTFYKIARLFGLSVEELMQLNEKETAELAIGEELKIKK